MYVKWKKDIALTDYEREYLIGMNEQVFVSQCDTGFSNKPKTEYHIPVEFVAWSTCGSMEDMSSSAIVRMEDGSYNEYCVNYLHDDDIKEDKKFMVRMNFSFPLFRTLFLIALGVLVWYLYFYYFKYEIPPEFIWKRIGTISNM